MTWNSRGEKSFATNHEPPRIGDWIQTYLGHKFYPFDPRPEEIHIADIAHALSNICRFTGHTCRFYSVAQHSVHVCDILPPDQQLAGLLHDASEAYLTDFPRPLKLSPYFASNYRRTEAALEEAIHARFHLPHPRAAAIHSADEAVLGTEILQLMQPLNPDWSHLPAPVPGLQLPAWTPARAKGEFLRRFHAIYSRHTVDPGPNHPSDLSDLSDPSNGSTNPRSQP